MSVTLATVADALIEFILSLLRDPEVAAEFDEDPDAALAARGLTDVSHADVCAVAPVVVERAQVVSTPQAQPQYHHSGGNGGGSGGGGGGGGGPKPPPEPHHDPVIREIKNITQQFSWIDDRDTIVDQSVNQNIWTEGGDVNQDFDNDAVVASGDEAIAAGDDVDIETNIDDSTNIEAGEDVHIGDNTTNNDIDGSFNESTDTTTATDNSTTASSDESFNDTTSTDVEGSGNDTAVEYTETNVEVDANVAFESEDTVIVEAASDEQF